MDNLQKFLIGSTWVDPASTTTMPVTNPATKEQFRTVAPGNAQDVDRAVAAAKAVFPGFPCTSKADRMDLVKTLKTVTEKRGEDLAQTMPMKIGAPISMARENLGNDDIPLREPIGVCGLRPKLARALCT